MALNIARIDPEYFAWVIEEASKRIHSKTSVTNFKCSGYYTLNEGKEAFEDCIQELRTLKKKKETNLEPITRSEKLSCAAKDLVQKDIDSNGID